MLTHHIPSTPPPDAYPEDIIAGGHCRIIPGSHPNVTTATTQIAVVTQGSQPSQYFDAVDLFNDGDRHHMPPSEPAETPPEVPHGPHFLSHRGECLPFFDTTSLIILYSIDIAASPAIASDVL
jgi:hypothetical protein